MYPPNTRTKVLSENKPMPSSSTDVLCKDHFPPCITPQTLTKVILSLIINVAEQCNVQDNKAILFEAVRVLLYKDYQSDLGKRLTLASQIRNNGSLQATTSMSDAAIEVKTCACCNSKKRRASDSSPCQLNTRLTAKCSKSPKGSPKQSVITSSQKSKRKPKPTDSDINNQESDLNKPINENQLTCQKGSCATATKSQAGKNHKSCPKKRVKCDKHSEGDTESQIHKPKAQKPAKKRPLSPISAEEEAFPEPHVKKVVKKSRISTQENYVSLLRSTHIKGAKTKSPSGNSDKLYSVEKTKQSDQQISENNHTTVQNTNSKKGKLSSTMVQLGTASKATPLQKKSRTVEAAIVISDESLTDSGPDQARQNVVEKQYIGEKSSCSHHQDVAPKMPLPKFKEKNSTILKDDDLNKSVPRSRKNEMEKSTMPENFNKRPQFFSKGIKEALNMKRIPRVVCRDDSRKDEKRKVVFASQSDHSTAKSVEDSGKHFERKGKQFSEQNSEPESTKPSRSGIFVRVNLICPPEDTHNMRDRSHDSSGNIEMVGASNKSDKSPEREDPDKMSSKQVSVSEKDEASCSSPRRLARELCKHHLKRFCRVCVRDRSHDSSGNIAMVDVNNKSDKSPESEDPDKMSSKQVSVSEKGEASCSSPRRCARELCKRHLKQFCRVCNNATESSALESGYKRCSKKPLLGTPHHFDKSSFKDIAYTRRKPPCRKHRRHYCSVCMDYRQTFYQGGARGSFRYRERVFSRGRPFRRRGSKRCRDSWNSKPVEGQKVSGSVGFEDMGTFVVVNDISDCSPNSKAPIPPSSSVKVLEVNREFQDDLKTTNMDISPPASSNSSAVDALDLNFGCNAAWFRYSTKDGSNVNPRSSLPVHLTLGRRQFPKDMYPRENISFNQLSSLDRFQTSRNSETYSHPYYKENFESHWTYPENHFQAMHNQYYGESFHPDYY